MTTPADLPTVRAAIAEALDDWTALSDRRLAWWIDGGGLPTFILVKLSDPLSDRSVQDELARWLVAQEDGPFEVEFPGSSLPVYRLRQRTRSEP